jgi:hypothetical protein
VAKIVRDFNRKKLAQRKAAAATARSTPNKKAALQPATVKQAALPGVASQPAR